MTELIRNKVPVNINVSTLSGVKNGPGTLWGQEGCLRLTQSGGNSIPVTPGVPIDLTVNLSYIYSGFVSIEVHEQLKWGGNTLHASRKVNYAGPYTLSFTPTTDKVELWICVYAGFPPPARNLFTVSSISYQKVVYEPKNTLVQICSRTDDKYPFGFNGMTKDNEVAGVGNHLDFGDRMYNPRLGKWFTRDNKTRKYPFASPYQFAGSNPILFQDYDGKDYDVHVNHKDYTIIVSATYYSIKENDDAVGNIIKNISGFWKSQGEKFQYAVGKGSNKVLYDIVFKLEKNNTTFTEGLMTGIDLTQPTPNEISTPNEHVFHRMVRDSRTGDPDGLDVRDKMYIPLTQLKDARTHWHEAGHGLGMNHNPPYMSYEKLIMKQFKVDQGDNTIETNIGETIGRAGIGQQKELKNDKTSDLGHAIKVTEEGSAPEGFKNGQIQQRETPAPQTNK